MRTRSTTTSSGPGPCRVVLSTRPAVRSTRLPAQNEHEVRSQQLSWVHPVERPHDPDVEVVSEPLAFGDVTGAVHDQRARRVAGGVADLPEQVAVGGDLVGCGVCGAGDAAAVQHHDGGLGAAELGLLGRRGLGGANRWRARGRGALAQVARERVSEDEEPDRSENDELDRRDGADGDGRAAPGPDRIAQIVHMLHRPERVRPARPRSFKPGSFGRVPGTVPGTRPEPSRPSNRRAPTCRLEPRRGLSPTCPGATGPRHGDFGRDGCHECVTSLPYPARAGTSRRFAAHMFDGGTPRSQDFVALGGLAKRLANLTWWQQNVSMRPVMRRDARGWRPSGPTWRGGGPG